MSLEVLTKQLTAAFDNKNYQECEDVLPKIKIELVKNDLLVPTTAIVKSKNNNDLIITRSILEIGALSSINLFNYVSFENYVLQLKNFYSIHQLPVSKNKNKLIALYLLLLLSRGLLDKFHIELEWFLNESKTVDDLENDDVNLKIPINLEKWMIDGDYFKIFEIFQQKKFPSDEFLIFEHNLLNQIRQEIIENFNKSYKSLPLNNLKILLFLNDYKKNDILELIKSQPNWVLKGDIVYFGSTSTTTTTTDSDHLDADAMDQDDSTAQQQHHEQDQAILKNCLFYAKEIETII